MMQDLNCQRQSCCGAIGSPYHSKGTLGFPLQLAHVLADLKFEKHTWKHPCYINDFSNDLAHNIYDFICKILKIFVSQKVKVANLVVKIDSKWQSSYNLWWLSSYDDSNRWTRVSRKTPNLKGYTHPCHTQITLFETLTSTYILWWCKKYTVHWMHFKTLHLNHINEINTYNWV